jgi:hypothetical protein
LLATALPVVAPGAATAQDGAATAMMPGGNPEADRLADAVRRLGASPRDLSALIEAGELSFRLGDATAAAALYKRAEQIDPANGRVKGGIGRILVNGERPGEALRYFDQAQRYGARMADYADDRGLAYDLIGQQERAQRDYRVALQRQLGADEIDEVRRRYALSLGISGQRDAALAQIDGLLRKSDRGAWRARAFILAMTGDVAGANKIATSMMPAGMAGGLSAFFQRLPTLSAADRAFAVHFGEVAPTPARLADARLVPALPALAPDPTAPPVQVAAVATPVVAQDRRGSQRSERRRGRDRRGTETAAAASTAPAAAPGTDVAATRAVPAATERGSTRTAPRTEVASNRAATAAVAPGAAGGEGSRASSPPPTAAAQAATAGLVPRTEVASAGTGAGSYRVAPSSDVAATRSVTPRNDGASGGGVAAPVAAAMAPRTDVASTPTTATAPSVSAIPGVVPGISTAPARAAVAAPVQTASAGAPARIAPMVRQTVQRANPVAPRNVPPHAGEDSILARIVAGITVPASELGVAPMPGAPPVAAGAGAPDATASLDEAARVAERNAAADEQKRQKLAAKRLADRAAAEKLASDRKAKEAADRKAKDAAARKLADAEAAAEKKAARAEPARIWVQVAGGPNEGDLDRAWKAAQGKAAALAGRRAYWTPLRATNRVVTGPFKTEAEARAMVNTLAKQGLSAFTFTSTAGQKMNRVGAQ